MPAQRIGEVFLALADTLAEDFEVTAFSGRLAGYCLELLHTDGAGVMLAGTDGNLELIASTDETTRRLELSELVDQDGPCMAAFRSGLSVDHPVPDAAAPPGPRFDRSARTAGYHGAHAVPMRHGTQVIGVLNLFRRDRAPLSARGKQMARTLADMATIGLLNQRAVASHRTVADQIQQAFTTRMIIEQAKGMLAGQMRISPDQAFHRLRRHARNTNRNLAELARAVVDDTATVPGD
ncbi:ANTAR domain-containing protein [Nucisporomicrobium flavum]|uniref:ANTAR domain-containing protein n=1 Tax=Nucisporomicrobium flavum TaxID=2785915 RepID=UPI003C2FFE18